MLTPRLRHVFAACAVFAAFLPAAGRGQWTSAYERVNLAGDFNDWDTLSTNMVLIDDGVWQAYQSFTNSSIQFKFTTASSTNQAWGENDQADFTAPIAATAEFPGNNNIVVNETAGHTLRFILDEASNAYRVEDVSPVFAPWINEVDYDSVGTDSNEWIELAGPAGLSLDGYRLALINQASNTYTTIDLAGASFTFGDEDSGIGFFVLGIVPSGLGVADYTPPGWTSDEIQNGPTDSIQLQRKTGVTNAHLIDYEGTNTFTLQDQVVIAADDNTTDRTIYLTGGPGYQFSAFTWTNTANRETPGAKNNGQSLLVPASDVLISNVANLPAIPDIGVPVHIEADLVAVDGASNLVATAFYRLGGSGPFIAQAMTPVSGDTWRTVSPIPGQPSGAVVDYYLFVAFDGFGQSSPVLAPADAPASAYRFGIPRLPAGSVWLNEINYRFDFFTSAATNEYLELAGPAGADLSGWQIQLFDTSLNYATYTLPAGTQLPNDEAGYGFLLLGDAGVPNVDIVFTNQISAGRSLSQTGAIRLVNELGFVEYLYTYSNPQTNQYPDAEYIGDDDNFVFEDQSLGLLGTGSGYAGFAWGTNTTLTAGTINPGQTLTGGGTDPGIPEVAIVSVRRVGADLEIVSTGTNTWQVLGEYSTNLLAGEAGWMPLNQVDNSYANGINTTLFELPLTDAPVMHFRIRQTGGSTPPPPVVSILDVSLIGNELEIVSTGNDTWPVLGEYSTNLLAGEAGWMPLSRISNTHDNGTNTTRFELPTTDAPVMHFRIRQTGGSTPPPPPPNVSILDVSLIGNELEIVSTGNDTWLVSGEYATDLLAGEAGWMPLDRISNSHDTGTNTTRFTLPPAGGPVLHFRVRQSAP